MLKILLKYKIAQIISMQESFFYYANLPKDIKLSNDLITLNYEKYSPFRNPEIITYKNSQQLYIWFTQLSLDSLLLIPEAFLLYKSLQKEGDGIYIFDTSPMKVFILKDTKLLASFVTDEMDAISLNILKNEYQIEKDTIFSKEEWEKRYLYMVNNIRIKDLYQFLKISLSYQDLYQLFIEKLTYPFIALLVFSMGISYFQSYLMQKKIDVLLEKYHTLKEHNSDIKKAIHKHNAEIRKYKAFEEQELNTPEPYKILYDFSKVIKKDDKAILKSFEFTNDTLQITLETKDGAIKYLKRLNAMPYFKNVVIQNSYKNKKTGAKSIRYSIELEGLNDAKH